MMSAPVLAWGSGGGDDCPFVKSKADQEKAGQLEESDK